MFVVSELSWAQSVWAECLEVVHRRSTKVVVLREAGQNTRRQRVFLHKFGQAWQARVRSSYT